ncbi:MAG: response regulator transcription factor [Chloroflexi bacterium]|nr:response regulator transcription factor [Chloroflexota bacterium]
MVTTRVMIVEDQPQFQELVKLLLSLDPQFEVVGSVTTGEEALQEIAQAHPDLVLLDFRLPGIDGLETARRIKKEHPATKIALVTAHTEEVLSRLAKEADILEVIPKAALNLDRIQKLLESP